LLYFDDGVVVDIGKEAAEWASRQVKVNLGLTENSAKCVWELTLKLKWLGFDLHLCRGRVNPGTRR